MTNEELAAIGHRVAAAAPGPWSTNSSEMYRGRCYVEGLDDDAGALLDADAQFIAHARSDVPALLAEIDRLRGEVARLLCPCGCNNGLEGAGHLSGSAAALLLSENDRLRGALLAANIAAVDRERHREPGP